MVCKPSKRRERDKAIRSDEYEALEAMSHAGETKASPISTDAIVHQYALSERGQDLWTDTGQIVTKVKKEQRSPELVASLAEIRALSSDSPNAFYESGEMGAGR